MPNYGALFFVLIFVISFCFGIYDHNYIATLFGFIAVLWLIIGVSDD